MTLPPIPGATIRGTTYHFNVPIPAAIREAHGGVMVKRGTMGTSDPREAERQVTSMRAYFDREVKDAQRRADQARLKKLLDPSDAGLVDALGGPSQVVAGVEGLRYQMAYLTAALPASAGYSPEFDYDRSGKRIRLPAGADEAPANTPDTVLQAIHDRAEEAAHRAYMHVVTAEIRKLKGMAVALGETVPAAPAHSDEGVIGLRELADKMAEVRGYTKQHKDSLDYTVRRWIELHGDVPVARFERSHLAAYADALKDLPVNREKRIQDLSIQHAIAAGKAEGLPTMGDKIRQTRIDHMKALTAYAVDQLGILSADPFSRFSIVKAKVKHSAKAEQKTRPYSPAQIRIILPYCAAKFDQDTLDRWAPIISTYTAMRREEIGQLHVSNIVDWRNGLTITITDAGEGQTVKNKHSFRTIPVPPVLLDAGFGEFVARRRQAGGGMLFMEALTHTRTKQIILQEVRPNGRGRHTETYGERFVRYVREPLKLIEPGLTFHSFRHAWTDAARRAGISAEIRRLIAGRLDDEDAVESAYGGADLLAEKLDAMIAVTPFLTKD